MSELTIDDFIIGDCLPNILREIPFKDELEKIFCSEKKSDFYLSIHCPNVVRFIDEIFENPQHLDSGQESSDFKSIQTQIKYDAMKEITEYLGTTDDVEKEKITKLLRIAALYHDIGKKIRSFNHPRLGANILLNSEGNGRKDMAKILAREGEGAEQSFTLLCSMVEHHDKFGVVSTGEASLAIFSDTLSFRYSVPTSFNKSITAIMLLTLADIAAVCEIEDEKKIEYTSDLFKKLIEKMKEEKKPDIDYNTWLKNNPYYNELLSIWNEPTSYLGLSREKVFNILTDWKELIEVATRVKGSRRKLREELILLDQNPDRTIRRITRLIKECCYTTARGTTLHKLISEENVESLLISFFGVHQFQDFCVKFAYIVRMDYALKFFKGILCACFRKKIKETKENNDSSKDGKWDKFNDDEKKTLEELPENDKQETLIEVVKIFMQVINGTMFRYNSIFELKIESAYRFGLQMGTLTADDNVRSNILNNLCNTNKDHVALTWIADEVTLWAMD